MEMAEAATADSKDTATGRRNRLRRSKPPPAMLNSHGRNPLSASSSTTFYDEPNFAGKPSGSRQSSLDLKRSSRSSATLDENVSAPDLLLKAFSDFLGKKKRTSSESGRCDTSQSLAEAFPPISPVEYESTDRSRHRRTESKRSSTASFEQGAPPDLARNSNMRQTGDQRRRSVLGSEQSSIEDRRGRPEVRAGDEKPPGMFRRRSQSLVRAAKRLSARLSSAERGTSAKTNGTTPTETEVDGAQSRPTNGTTNGQPKEVKRNTSFFRSRKRRKSPPPVSYYNRVRPDTENGSDGSLPLQGTISTDSVASNAMTSETESDETAEPIFHALTTEDNAKVDLGQMSPLDASSKTESSASASSSIPTSPKRSSADVSSAPKPVLRSRANSADARSSDAFMGGWRLKAAKAAEAAAKEERRKSTGGPATTSLETAEASNASREKADLLVSAPIAPIAPLKVVKPTNASLAATSVISPVLPVQVAVVKTEDAASPATGEGRRRLVKKDRRISKNTLDAAETIKGAVQQAQATTNGTTLQTSEPPKAVVVSKPLKSPVTLEMLKMEAEEMDAPLEPPPRSPSRPRSMNLSSLESLSLSNSEGTKTPALPYAAQTPSLSSTESLGPASSLAEPPLKISKVSEQTSSSSLNSNKSTPSTPSTIIPGPSIPAPRIPAARREKGKESPLRNEVTDSPPPQEEKRVPKRPSDFPVPIPNHRSSGALSAASASASRGGSSSTSESLRPVAKVFVICCTCKYWHDLPSAWYADMLKNGSVTKCPYCVHPMSTKCCAGYTCVVYLHQRHH